MATSQMISRKNITLVYKRSTIISFNKNKNTKTIIRLRFGNFRIPRLRLGEYSLIITSPSANNC